MVQAGPWSVWLWRRATWPALTDFRLSLRQRFMRQLCRPDEIDLLRFESLGENCEFGFLLSRHQNGSGGFFRWAFTPLHSLINILSSDFEGVYALDQLKPRFGAMVQDMRYDILFHSRLRSEQQTDGSFEFIASAADRQQIHANEQEKVDYLVAKFRRRLSEERLILVLKAAAPPTAKRLRQLLVLLRPALRQRGSTLLLVTPAASDQRPGKVRRLGPHLLHGTVAFMPPGESADALDYKHWEEILKHAYFLAFFPKRYALTWVVLATLGRCGISGLEGWWEQPMRPL